MEASLLISKVLLGLLGVVMVVTIVIRGQVLFLWTARGDKSEEDAALERMSELFPCDPDEEKVQGKGKGPRDSFECRLCVAHLQTTRRTVK